MGDLCNLTDCDSFMFSVKSLSMVNYTRYDEPTAFSGGPARILVDTTTSDEKFILGIDCAENRFFNRWGTKLVLTDQRVIALRSKIIGSTVEDYKLESINHVEYESTTISGELELSGAGFGESYNVPKGMGRDFVNEIRYRL